MRSWRVALPYVMAMGVASFVAAGGWWWMVFRQVMLAGYITPSGALTCLAAETSRCALAEALCGGHHILGIRHYDATVFWIGVGIVAATAAVPVLSRVLRTAMRWRSMKSVRSARLLPDQARS